MIPLPTPSLPILITSFISKPSFRRLLSFSGGIESIWEGREGVSAIFVMPGTGAGAEAAVKKGRLVCIVHPGQNDVRRRIKFVYTTQCGSFGGTRGANWLECIFAMFFKI